MAFFSLAFSQPLQYGFKVIARRCILSIVQHVSHCTQVKPLALHGLTLAWYNSRSYAAKSPIIGARHYASSSNGINKYSKNITEPKSQGASQAMCKLTETSSSMVKATVVLIL